MLFRSYPRKINDKIVFTLKDAMDIVYEYTGKVTINISLYKFDSIINDEPIKESVVIDKILIETNRLSKTRDLHEALTRLTLKHYVAYTGEQEKYYTFIMTKECTTTDFEPCVLRWKKKRLDTKLTSSYFINIDLTKQVVLINTYNTKSRSFCIPMKYEELYLEQIDIDRIAKHKRGRVTVPEADQFRLLDLGEYE